MADWRRVTVEQIKAGSDAALATGPFGSSISSKTFREVGIPVIRGSNLSQDVGTRLNDDGLVFLDDATAKSFRRSTVRPGDLIFTSWGTINQVGLIDNRSRYQEYVISNKQMKLTPDIGQVNSLFLYYLFSSPRIQSKILSNGIGSSVPGFNLGQLRAMEIDIPCLPEQHLIASILGALDDKIELNRKMSATLEAIARALFKSWFVDFDPVRAKAEGRDLGLPAEIAALFPDSFEESERGQVPSGWAIRSLLSICDLVERGITPKYELGSRRFIVNQKVNRGSTLDLGALKELSCGLAIPTNKLTREFDVLVNCLGEGTLGRVHLFRGTTAYAVDQHMAICRPSVSHFGPLIYERLANPEGQAIIEAGKTGTTGMTMLNISKLREFPVLWPGIALAETYGYAVASFWQRINLNDIMSRNLAAIRDSLLPKLISGEIRVTDAERLLAAPA